MSRLSCVRCEGQKFIQAYDAFELERTPEMVVSSHTGKTSWFSQPAVPPTQTFPAKLEKIDDGLVVVCLRCMLQQRATVEGGMERIERIRVAPDPAAAGEPKSRRERDDEEPKPPIRPTMDKDIPMRRPRPYA